MSDSAPLDLTPPEEWYEPWLRVGLYLGAAFQLVCILAVIVLPGSAVENMEEQGNDEDDWVITALLLGLLLCRSLGEMAG